MFSLLVRQYDTVGELMRATENTYVIDNKTKEDAVVMWVALSRIRSDRTIAPFLLGFYQPLAAWS